jgi:signal transduction histidine kinase
MPTKDLLEQTRIAALLNYKVLDTEPENSFDSIVQLASKICNTPISLVSLVDENRQWFKAKVGVEVNETPREVAVCNEAIKTNEIFEVENLQADNRFKDNELILNSNFHFYAGKQLTTPSGYNVGTLCVIDNKPRKLTDDQRQALEVLAEQVVNQLELRRKNELLSKEIERLLTVNDDLSRKTHINKKLIGLISHDLRSPIAAVTNLLSLQEENLIPKESLLGQLDNVYKTLKQSTNLLDSLVGWANMASNIDSEELNNELISNSEIDLHELTESIIKLFSVLSEQHKAEVINKIQPHFTVKGNVYMISFILRNLVKNAVKSSQNSKIELSANLTGEGFEVHIEDNGKGLSEEMLNAFNKSDNSSNALGIKTKTGFGLGVTVAKDFAEQMEGKLVFENRKDSSGLKATLFVPYLL